MSDVVIVGKLIAQVERLRSDGCPVAQQARRTAELALRRWRSFERRARRRRSTLDDRVEDLAKGLRDGLDPNPALVGPLMEDYRCLAQAFAGVFNRYPRLVGGAGSEDEIAQLYRVEDRFRGWARRRRGPITGEWECDYDDAGWREIYAAFTSFIQAWPYTTWNAKTTQSVLYLIARDNDIGYLMAEVARDPERLMFLARAGLGPAERDARWQIAKALGGLQERLEEVEPILLELARNPEEYVRRRALMALGRLQSRWVERLVEDAWASNDQYQRMAGLEALRDAGSSRLEEYLKKAETDGRPYLVAWAAKVRSGNTD